MLSDFLSHAGEYVTSNPWLALVAVFVAGALTASNPCVLAMIPLMMSYVAGRKDDRSGPLRALAFSVVFVAGLAITFTTMGVFAALAGKIYGDISDVWKWIVAGVCLVMGLHLMGILNFSIPTPIKAPPKVQGFLGAFLLGLLFGIVSAPCAAPILIVILTYLAGSGASIPYGALLLLLYALGHSVLIIAAGTSMGAARKLIESKRVTKATEIMRRVAGASVVLVGVYFAYKAL